MVSRRQGYICPQCRDSVRHVSAPESYRCASCSLTFPVLFGIPDFRLAPDRYLTLEQERDKAARLHTFAQSHDFDALVAEYYRITDDVPAPQARRFAAYVRGGVARGGAILPKLGAVTERPLLDAGCGAGGLVAAAAAEGRAVCGTDIALRWLVIAAKRLEELGLTAELVCADIAASPFPDGQFGAAAAVDLLEHVDDADETLRALGRAMAPGAPVYLSAANRFTIGRYPLAGLWGIGFMPRPLRRRYVTLRRGLDTLRHATLLSPGALARRLRRAGFAEIRLKALDIPAARPEDLSRAQQFALPLYAALRRRPVLGRLLAAIGPAFEITARRPVAARQPTTPAGRS